MNANDLLKSLQSLNVTMSQIRDSMANQNVFQKRNFVIYTYPFATPGLVKQATIYSSGSALLFNCFGYNSGSACFIQLFDTDKAPANGAAPVMVGKAQATDNFNIPGLYNLPWNFCKGIYVAASTTAETLTLVASNLVTFYAQFLPQGNAGTQPA